VPEPSRWTADGRRARFVIRYGFPDALRDKLVELHPDMAPADADATVEALRGYLDARRRGEDAATLTPVIEEAWREFILMTSLYRAFCNSAFGEYLHYPPEKKSPADGGAFSGAGDETRTHDLLHGKQTL
jgi:hypothetical protein